MRMTAGELKLRAGQRSAKQQRESKGGFKVFMDVTENKHGNTK